MMGKYAVLFLIIISGLGQVSEAATNVSACRTISSPGEYVLNTSLSNINVIWAGGYCISITSSDVVFDGNGKTIVALVKA